jgi:hypothetical protein
MQTYIKQLLEDIENLTRNPPPAPYIEVPPHMADMPEMAELALSPPTTLEELTGIPFEAFPNILELKKKQWKVLAEALKRLIFALNMQIVDLPENFPEDAFYNLIVMHWDDPVQYLPLAGYDIEFCSRDPDTCPYGEDCNFCYGENPDDEFIDGTGQKFIGGLFNDDGSRIDPLTVPLRELCLRCKSFLSEDWEDNILCTLNRNDQKDSDDFKCYAFDQM